MIYNPPFEELLEFVMSTKIIGFDTETTGLNPLKDKVLSFAVSDGETTYCVDVSMYGSGELNSVLGAMELYNTIIIQNAVFDISFIQTNFGVMIENVWDTMLASQILNNGKNGISHSLLAILDRHALGSKEHEEKKNLLRQKHLNHQSGVQLSDDMLWYVGEDTIKLKRLYLDQAEMIQEANLQKVMKLENDLVPVIARMQLGGCLVDESAWREKTVEWESKRSSLLYSLHRHLEKLSKSFSKLSRQVYTTEAVMQTDLFGESTMVSDKVNFSSQSQILKIFEDCELPKPMKEDKESVDEDSIKTYINENPDTPLAEFLDTLLEYREYDKLISTYGEKFLAKLDENNYIHTAYTQCRTKTGRLSSTNPNLQNIPQGELREFFIAKEGHKLITCDMSSAEVAIAADYSKEPLLLNALAHGEDMHSKLASVSFSILFDRNITVSKSDEEFQIDGYVYTPAELRQVHKTVLFAKFYKAGAKRVYNTLAKYINRHHAPSDHMKVAHQISKALDKKMPKLTKYLTKLIDDAQKNHQLRGSKLGRRRWFHGDVYGEAANFPIQNTNGEAMKIALIRIDRFLRKYEVGRVVMTIHDEVVVETPDKHAKGVAKKVKEIMSEALSFFLDDIEGGASVTIKQHWEK